MKAKALGNILIPYIPGVIVLDFNHRVLWSSDYIKRTFDTVGKTFNEFFSFELDLQFIGPKHYLDKSNRSFNIEIITLEDADPCHKLILLFDLHDFEHTENKLFCYERIMENIHEGILISDASGKIVAYNSAQEKLEEQKAESMIGRYLWDAYNYQNISLSEHHQVLESGNPLLDCYKAHAYSKGLPQYVSYSTFPVIKSGEKIAVFSVSKNETKLHELLEETIELKRFTCSTLTNEQLPGKFLNNGTRYTFSDIVGTSDSTRQLIREAQTISWLDNNILIVGETGTGKEVYAQSIHNHGKKNSEPFIGINCAALPENLLEGILFGTAKGSFTGAVERPGLFEVAGEGSIFLDELNSMPISMQTKLLRVLQEKKVNRVGGSQLIPIKCRVICAMNEDPQILMSTNRLRQDLFYRIAGLSLYIPPLREREDDINALVDYYILKYNRLMNRSVVSLSKELGSILLRYHWPGNVREMEHVIENLMVRSELSDLVLELKHLPPHLLSKFLPASSSKEPYLPKELLNDVMDRTERNMIIHALKRHHGNLTAASKELGIIRQSLMYRMKRLNIERPHLVNEDE